MKRPFWQITGRVTAGVVALALAPVVVMALAAGEPTPDDTPTTTTTISTVQMQEILRTPLARQVLDIGNALAEQRPTQTIGQRAVGLSGPIGADVSDIHATATLSPGARLEKGLSGFDPWPNIDAAAYTVLVVVGAVICGTWVLMISSWTIGRTRR